MSIIGYLSFTRAVDYIPFLKRKTNCKIKHLKLSIGEKGEHSGKDRVKN